MPGSHRGANQYTALHGGFDRRISRSCLVRRGSANPEYTAPVPPKQGGEFVGDGSLVVERQCNGTHPAPNPAQRADRLPGRVDPVHPPLIGDRDARRAKACVNGVIVDLLQVSHPRLAVEERRPVKTVTVCFSVPVSVLGSRRYQWKEPSSPLTTTTPMPSGTKTRTCRPTTRSPRLWSPLTTPRSSASSAASPMSRSGPNTLRGKAQGQGSQH